MIRRAFGWTTIALSLILLPLSLFWWAKDEPKFVLVLSFLALTYTGIDILFTAQVKEQGAGPKDKES